MVEEKFRLLIATTNSGKVREITKILRKHPIELVSLNEFDIKEVPETATTFEENANLKAAGYARQTALWTLADDSGLEVEALDNAPGVLSARYAGIGATDSENNQKLLSALAQTTDKTRVARFVCVMSIADPGGEIVQTVDGICPGAICEAPRGTNGFGYDPIFVPRGFEQSFGELGEEEKNELSHRSKALKKIVIFLSQILDSKLDR